MQRIEIYTDGACSGNPGPGGWGCVIRWDDEVVTCSGYEPHTTNNRMELTAAIVPLRALPCPCTVTLYTDSQYLAKAIQEGWLKNWKRNGWRTASRLTVKNRDLWQELDSLLQQHVVTFVWVKGHSGNKYNEMCDQLATSEIARGAK